MLKRGTWLLLLSAIALTGGVLLLENNSGPRTEETASNEIATEPLFSFEEKDIEQFSVVREDIGSGIESGEELSFVKGDDGNWEMTVPESAIAQNGAIAFLLSQVTTTNARPVATESETELDSNATEDATEDATESLEPYGLAEPTATLSLTANSSDYQLYVGGPDFAGDQRYVQAIEDNATEADSGAEARTASNIYLISGDIITAINRPTEEWLLNDETTKNEATTNEATEEDAIENPPPEDPVEDVLERENDQSATEEEEDTSPP